MDLLTVFTIVEVVGQALYYLTIEENAEISPHSSQIGDAQLEEAVLQCRYREKNTGSDSFPVQAPDASPYWDQSPLALSLSPCREAQYWVPDSRRVINW
jgi:hypothetical protein